MSNILKFPTALERSPHLSGQARCLQCNHEWAAVVPVGCHEFECPECHTFKGVLVYGCQAEFAEWTCGCGCNLFKISSPGNVLCWKCGAAQGGFIEPS